MRLSAAHHLALSRWIAGINYRQLRRVELLLPASLADGRRLRGLMLAPDMAIGRDRVFYAIENSNATPLNHTEVLFRYSLPHLRHLHMLAVRQANARLHRQFQAEQSGAKPPSSPYLED